MDRAMRHVPNMLTVARLCCLPLVVWAYALHAPAASWSTAGIILLVALSDVADGLVARRWHAESEFGRWVDPVVDRVFFFTLAAMLLYFGALPWWAAAPLLVRDGAILLLVGPALWLVSEGPQISPLGKAGNVVLLFAVELFVLDAGAAAWAFLAVGGGLYVASGLLYLGKALAWLGRARAKGGAAA